MQISQEKAAGKDRRLHRQLYAQVLAAIVLGALVGHFFPTLGESLKPLGDAFVKLVKMIIAPVIFLTVTTGIAGLRDLERVGGVAFKAFGYFLVDTLRYPNTYSRSYTITVPPG